MNRRRFLSVAGGASAAVCLAPLAKGSAKSIPVIDSHIHLFDTSRPQGVPWPTKQDGILFQPALPGRYRKIAEPHGIVGAIEVEASPWLEDNQWVLDLAAKDKIIVGTVGDLEPGKPEFRSQLDRFHRNPLFRGIRYGNIWGRDLGKELAHPDFVAGLRAVAEADLSLDTANQTPGLISAALRVTDLVPNLRVILDHLPQMKLPTNNAELKAYRADLRKLGERHQVYVKVSEVFRRVEGRIPRELSFYRNTLDEIFGTFGEDRVIFGSDWPNSDQWLPFADGLTLVREYFLAKGHNVAEKYFWRNSLVAYKWTRRDVSQPSA
jgi:predicted TIM-barrel fold metal-dependent hydrolase